MSHADDWGDPNAGDDIGESVALSMELAQQTGALRQELVEVLGLRAEWMGPRLYKLYRRPDYLPELLTEKPCILSGGRGTGKTTVLQILSYEGAAARAGSDDMPRDPRNWPYVGFYWRFDSNQVTAFTGPAVDEETWVRVFGHYVNLVLCGKLTQYVLWFQKKSAETVSLDQNAISAVARSLCISDDVEDIVQLDAKITDGLVDLEARVNNLVDDGPGKLSLQSAPLNRLITELRRTELFQEKRIFFLLDEFENLLDYQQRVLNTMIKHAGGEYTFKIGVKETGHREKRTLALHEVLQEPADYRSVNISERLIAIDFNAFARSVVNERLASLSVRTKGELDVRKSLPALSETDEAVLLGVDEELAELRTKLVTQGVSEVDLERFDGLPPLHRYLVGYWADSSGVSPAIALTDMLSSDDCWQQRLRNYQHAMLFTIRAGHRGSRIQKFYSGWDTYVLIARGNLRYLLQLVLTAYLHHLDAGKSIEEAISPVHQSEAAVSVGRVNLDELPGLETRGAEVTTLVTALGRIFEVLAREPKGHAPEINQFRVDFSVGGEGGEVQDLLNAGVRSLALERFPSNKRALSSGEVLSWDYRVHPVYAPFFGFSHRMKRRLKLSSSDIRRLSSDSSKAVEDILKRHGRRSGMSKGTSDIMSLF